MAAKGFFASMFKKSYDYAVFQDCVDAMHDANDAMARVTALESLARLHLEHMVLVQDTSKLEELMRNDDNLQVQEAAITLLGAMGTAHCIDALLDMLAFPDQWLRVKAAIVLSEIKEQRVLEALRDAYDGIKPEYQQSVKKAISKLEEALNALPEQSPLNSKPQAIFIGEEPEQKKFSSNSSISFDATASGASNKSKTSVSISYETNKEEPLFFGDGFIDSPSAQKQEPPKPQKAQSDPYVRSYRDKKTSHAQKYNDSEEVMREMLEHHLHVASGSPADPSISGALYKAYAEKREEAEHFITTFLHKPQMHLRLQALQSLITLNKPDKYLNNFKQLLRDSSPEICFMAIVAVSSIEEEDIAKDILPHITSSSEKLQRFAQNYFVIHSNVQIAEILINSLVKSQSEDYQIMAISLLIRMENEQIRGNLKKILQNNSLSDKIITVLLEKLPVKYNDVVIASLPSLILREDERIFSLFLRFLGDPEDLIISDAIAFYLKNENPLVRGRAIALMGELNIKEHTKEIFEMFTDSDDFIRLSAAKTLGKLQAKEYSNIIFKAIVSDKANANKFEYIKVLFELQGAKAAMPLLSLLHSATDEFKYSIMELISKHDLTALNVTEVAKQILPFLNTTDVRVFFYTVLILVKIGMKDFPYDKQKLLQTVWNLAKDPRNPANIRRDAVFCIYSIAGESGRQSLKAILTNEKDESVIAVVLTYLSQLGGHDSLEILKIYKNSPIPFLSASASKLLDEMA